MKIVQTNKKDAAKDAKAANQEKIDYYKKHKLKADKDYSKDKVHGPVLEKLNKRIQLGHTKATEGIAESREEKKKALKKPEVHQKKKDAPQPNTYEYPLINNKPMSPDSKRKFRSKMRPLIKSGMTTEKATKTVIEKYFSGTFPASNGTKRVGTKTTSKKEEPKTKTVVSAKKKLKVTKKSDSRSDD